MPKSQPEIQSVVEYLRTIRRLLSQKETADILNVSTGQLTTWRITGMVDLPYIKCGPRQIKYDPSEVFKFCVRRTAAHTGESGLMTNDASQTQHLQRRAAEREAKARGSKREKERAAS